MCAGVKPAVPGQVRGWEPAPQGSPLSVMALTWKFPWWDSKSPGKVTLGSGTRGTSTFFTLQGTRRLCSQRGLSVQMELCAPPTPMLGHPTLAAHGKPTSGISGGSHSTSGDHNNSLLSLSHGCFRLNFARIPKSIH